jgi:hypothetical protein
MSSTVPWANRQLVQRLADQLIPVYQNQCPRLVLKDQVREDHGLPTPGG